MLSDKSKRYFERLIALILASIVVLVFFVQVEKVSVIAERESVQQGLSSIRLGMQFFMLENIVKGMNADMRAYENTNPMRMQAQPPPNYAGEFSAEEAINVPPGKWYYDRSAGELVYKISRYPLLEGSNEPRELRYRLTVSTDDNDAFRLRLLEKQ